MFKFLPIIVAVVLSGGPTFAQEASAPQNLGLVFTITGIQDASGTIYCRLYAGKKGFPDKGEFAVAELKVQPSKENTNCQFQSLEAGIYALSVWHDVDDDGVLDSNFIGIPKEPVGASNDAKGKFGPPKFKKAAISYRSATFEQTVSVE